MYNFTCERFELNYNSINDSIFSLFQYSITLLDAVTAVVVVADAGNGHSDDGFGGSIETDGICKEKRK